MYDRFDHENYNVVETAEETRYVFLEESQTQMATLWAYAPSVLMEEEQFEVYVN